jgi:biotin carboxyl carrier protein
MSNGIKINIEAPFDVFVVSMAAQGAVKKGDQLVTLRSLELERTEIQISLHSQHIDIIERPLTDGRVDAEITLARQKADLLRKDVTELESNVEYARLAIQMGIMPENPDPPKYRVDLFNAQTDLLAAELAINHQTLKKGDAILKIALARAKLQEHKNLLNKMKDALTVRAPMNGNFVVSSGVGLFVQKGDFLGTLSS